MVQFRRIIHLISLFFGLFAIASCNSSESKKTIQTEGKIQSSVNEKNMYSVDGEIVIKWTAYKFTEKAKVSGSLDSVELFLKNESGSITSLLTGASMKIYTASVNSNNEARDLKLVNYFFKPFQTEVIKGKILSVSEDSGNLEILMNKVSQKVDYTYNLEADTLHLSALVELSKWNADEALDKLNEVCFDLHKGADGISKLWPDITVDIRLPLKRN